MTRMDSASRYSLAAASAVIWPPTDGLLPDDLCLRIEREAAASDERGRMSPASLAQLREAGYFGLAVPTALSGKGAGLLQSAAVQRRLAMADPALAIAVNMHLFSVGMAVEHWRSRAETCGLLLEAIATQHRILSSAFAEPGLAGTMLRSKVKARRTAGGYLVSGRKSPCSLAGVCDLVCFQMETDPREPESLLLAMIPAGVPGMRVEATWDALGMRASDSDTLVFDGCFVPDALVFHRCEPGFDDDDIFAAGLVWFCVTTTATYLGVVKAALDLACRELRGSPFVETGLPRSLSPTVQGELGEVVGAVLAIEAGCAAVADRMDRREHDARTLLPHAVAVKYAAVDACVRAVERTAELAGGRSYARASAAARYWRDVQAIRFHPPARLVSRQLLGRWALDVPFAFELDEQAALAREPEQAR